MLASDLYALSQGTRNEGDVECHWCSAPTKRMWVHDDAPYQVIDKGARLRILAKRPGSLYVCTACWMFRRKRCTVKYLTGGLKDCQELMSYSWYFTREGAWVIDRMDYQTLYEKLLDPPLQFCLALLVGQGLKNHLQLMLVNDLPEIKANTSLQFTLNGIPHNYSVYELENALTSADTNGREPGVRALVNFLGPYKPLEEAKEKKAGRPTIAQREMKSVRRTIKEGEVKQES